MSLEPKAQAKLLQVLQLLEDLGVSLGFPYSSQIDGRLRELRTQYGKDKYRIFYYADPSRTFKLLHAFRKRTDKVSEKDKKLAIERMQKDMRKVNERLKDNE